MPRTKAARCGSGICSATFRTWASSACVSVTCFACGNGLTRPSRREVSQPRPPSASSWTRGPA